ncbi:hypothetical protein QQF64_035874 [Cirrhinus molitorella]|uniref:Uncharacterized protein n=1 Tax=Cirrhinus molitorella TaxID=172907 RepID=A0ABR3NH04_9TELE
MAFIKEESEDMKFEEAFRVKQEDTEEQTDLMSLKNPDQRVVGKWFQQYEDLLEELGIKDVPYHIFGIAMRLACKTSFARAVGDVGWTVTVENAKAGFRVTGMFLVNKSIIIDDIYAPNITTERAVLSTGTEIMVENTPGLIHRDTFSEDLVYEEVIITSQEDMERFLFCVFTTEQDTSNHQECVDYFTF